MARELIVRPTHRALLYRDGVLERVLEPGRYALPSNFQIPFVRRPEVDYVLVDIRERDLTIKGQEILTADKVALRVSIVVQFRVLDPEAAIHRVTNYEERLYTDVQLAARRSLASMSLEEILTNRNRLSEDIHQDVVESAASYGVAILRADVKDLVFPGNLQEIMNRVLAAERMSQAQLVEARTRAETQQIDAQAKAAIQALEAQSQADARRLSARAEAEVQDIKTDADIRTLREREHAAEAYSSHPVLLRLRELEALQDLSRLANARIYIGFEKHSNPGSAEE